jgi:fructose-1,6-bisphosphatase/inositol monophosphatase family enzyme
VLTSAELVACAALMDEVAGPAMARIADTRPKELGTKTWAADWVTETDLAIERFVRDAIGERFPAHRIDGEEFGVTGGDDAPATWFLDPVDGTTNYVHGLPVSSFSICVADEAGAAAALVADPYRRETLSAVRGRGALRNGSPTRCSEATSLMGGIVLTEFTAQTVWSGMAELMEALSAAGCVTRIMGSNAFSVSSVAAGRAVATIIGRFNRGDCLGGTLIAAESGARVLAASNPPRDGETLVCAAPGVVEELFAVWPDAPAVAA